MCKHDANWLTFTLCRKCKKLRNCFYTTNDSYICKSCSSELNLIDMCRSCGRECLKYELNKYGGYCGYCLNDNIIECELCGKEAYNHNSYNGVCEKCLNGINKPCNKCGDYINSSKLSSDNLCEKCSIQIHKKLRKSEVNEVVECVQCGRESLVNDLKESSGLCIYCYSEELEIQVKKLKKRVYSH